MHAGQGPAQQLARWQHDRFRLVEAFAQPFGRLFLDDLEIADLHGADAGLHLRHDRSQRAVGDQKIRNQKQEAGIEHRRAGAPDRARISQGDRRGVVGLGNQVVDRFEADGAHRRKAPIRRMLPDHRLVSLAGQKDELGRERGRDGRQITGRKQGRQAAVEELAGELIAPDRQQDLGGVRQRSPPGIDRSGRFSLADACLGAARPGEQRGVAHWSRSACMRLML